MRSFALALILFSGMANADIGLYLDGTQKLVKTSVLAQEFNWITFWKCQDIKSCERIAANHSNIGVIYTDTKKINAYLQQNSNIIASFVRLHTSRYDGFKLVVDSVTDVSGRYYLLVKVAKSRGKATKNGITQAIADEINAVYGL